MNKGDAVNRVLEVTLDDPSVVDRKHARDVIMACLEAYAILMLRSYRNRIDIGTQEALNQIAEEIEKR